MGRDTPMKKVLWLTVLLTLVSTMAIADGPVTGVVSGVVSDPSGSPIPGVGVTISGDRGEKYTQTGGSGEYRFALLEPGSYVVVATLEGLGEASSAALVAAGKRSEINMKLVAVTAETITVTSEAPLIDRLNVGVGTTMQAEVGIEVTGDDRTYFGIINFMPGTNNLVLVHRRHEQGQHHDERGGPSQNPNPRPKRQRPQRSDESGPSAGNGFSDKSLLSGPRHDGF